MLLRKVQWIALPVLFLTMGSSAWAQNGFSNGFSCDGEFEPGSRMKFHSGRQWPVTARPCGPGETYIQQYHTAHYWPDPYRWEDRSMTRSFYAAQRNLGWISATTLYEQHFDSLSNELNVAGRQHLRWILLHAPASRRMTWVQAGDSAESSDARLASVQSEAARMVGSTTPLIMLRTTLPIGTSAEEMDLIRRAYLENIPKPRIPVTVSGSSSVTGAPSGGGANSPQTSQGQ